MAELSVDCNEAVMRLKAAAALGLQLQENLSQAQACAQVGIDPKTYRKYLRGDEELMAVREATEGALVQGVLPAIKAYLAGLERLEKIVADPMTAPRDLVAALKFLESTLVRFVGVLPASQGYGLGTGAAGKADDPIAAVPFNFDGPVTIRVEAQKAPTIIDQD
jgi:hypothetical protein